MSETYLMTVIRTTELKGKGTKDDIAHRHVQYYTIDGTLLAETCDLDECRHI